MVVALGVAVGPLVGWSRREDRRNRARAFASRRVEPPADDAVRLLLEAKVGLTAPQLDTLFDRLHSVEGGALLASAAVEREPAEPAILVTVPGSAVRTHGGMTDLVDAFVATGSFDRVELLDPVAPRRVVGGVG